MSSDRLYDPAYVGAALAAFVARFEDGSETFLNAFENRNGFIDRSIESGGQQVFDTKARINFELRPRLAVIYLRETDVAMVAEAAARSLSSVIGADFKLAPQGDQPGMRDVRTAMAAAEGAAYSYVLSVWGATVPGPSKGADDRDGCHVMLSANVLAEAA